MSTSQIYCIAPIWAPMQLLQCTCMHVYLTIIIIHWSGGEQSVDPADVHHYSLTLIKKVIYCSNLSWKCDWSCAHPNRVGQAFWIYPKCDVNILQTFPFKPLNWSSCDIHSFCKNVCKILSCYSINENEDREVWSFTQSHTNLSYLESVPNFRNTY